MGGGTGRRIVLTGGVLLALLAVVGLASRAHTSGGGGGARSVDGTIVAEYGMLLILAGTVVAIPAVVWAIVTLRREEQIQLPRRRNWMVSVLLTMVALSVASVLIANSDLVRRHHGKKASQPLKPLGDLANRKPAKAENAQFDWVPVIVVGSLTAVGLAAAGVLLVRRREPKTRKGVAEALAVTLDESLGELAADLDPRSTVIAAYAQMEKVLARHGLPRHASEAPREYLRRVLPGIGAGAESVERLTALYEHARFSTHEVDGGMRDEAVGALESLRDELRSSG